MDGNDQPGAVAHALELPSLQIGRQAAVIRTLVTALQRLPGEIIGFVGMAVDQPQQPLVEHLIDRLAAAQEIPLLRRNAQAEQQRRRSRHQPRQRRMKQAMQPGQGLDTLRRIRTTVQQRRQIDAGKSRQQMRKADEAAKQAVAINPSVK